MHYDGWHLPGNVNVRAALIIEKSYSGAFFFGLYGLARRIQLQAHVTTQKVHQAKVLKPFNGQNLCVRLRLLIHPVICGHKGDNRP